MTAAPPRRPVRKDVARNRTLLLQAADEVFTERGVDATLDDIAQHAGVGVATAYRHFANKQALLEALFADRISKVVQIVQEADALDDPLHALQSLFYGIGELQAADRGLRESFGANHGVEKAARAREQLEPPARRIVQRAVDAGVLRPEFAFTDVPLLVWMIGSVADYAGATSPGLWRRYMGYLFNGILTQQAPHQPVTEPALDEDQLDCVMREFHQGRLHR